MDSRHGGSIQCGLQTTASIFQDQVLLFQTVIDLTFYSKPCEEDSDAVPPFSVDVPAPPLPMGPAPVQKPTKSQSLDNLKTHSRSKSADTSHLPAFDAYTLAGGLAKDKIALKSVAKTLHVTHGTQRGKAVTIVVGPPSGQG